MQIILLFWKFKLRKKTVLVRLLIFYNFLIILSVALSPEPQAHWLLLNSLEPE